MFSKISPVRLYSVFKRIFPQVFLTLLLTSGFFWLFIYLNGTSERLLLSLPSLDQPSSSSSDEFVVEAGLSVGEIIDDLILAGVNVDRTGLITLLEFTGTATNIRSGTYKSNPSLTTGVLFYSLGNGPLSRYNLEFVSGYRNEEIFEILDSFEDYSEEEWTMSIESVLALGSNNVLLRELMLASTTDMKSNRSDLSRPLQGYLAPGIYLIEEETTLLDILAAMLQTSLDALNANLVADAAQQGLTIHQAVTLASIVEREVFVPREMPLVASVFLNRLAQGMPMQSDATAQYALASNFESVQQYGWWKTRLQQDELTTLSPYNTFVIAGLPRGPISNPSVEALFAVIYPAKSNYLFFLTSPACDGTHSFAETYIEHLQNAELFDNSPCASSIE